MAKIKIDAGMLTSAMEDHSGYTEYYLDKQTGDILVTFEETMDDEDETRKKIEAEPDRYLFIEPVPSRDGFELMRSFVDSLPDSETKRLLDKALSWKKPFSNFKDALCDFPELRERWFAFHDMAMQKSAREWLEDEGIEAELTDGCRPAEGVPQRNPMKPHDGATLGRNGGNPINPMTEQLWVGMA